MKIKTFLSLVMLLVIFLSASVNFAQEGAQDEMMKKWQEYMTPGPEHQHFAKAAGNWKASVVSYMDGQEVKSEGTATNEMIFGGRYLKSSFKGNMMGMPFEGMSLDAYDNATKEFINIWIDSFGTGILYTKGKFDEKNKEYVYTGMMVDPMLGKEIMIKNIFKYIDDDHQQMIMYMVDGGKETKSMQIEYVRVK
ncbi:MAG: hypothetical protein CVV24_08865 [Ignavibacteriae bacterium HGW-Ignavibacteriae-3]|nr:MAG: hypothetical protein CVV24_08865 [Ignavibacteriae bacterium HGW-Ignavibacteriae-3]